MKFCPYCNAYYEIDFVYCLTDGNTLVESTGEIETVVLSAFNTSVSGHGQESASDICSSCGTANRLSSRFCKKCGAAVQAPASPAVPAFANAKPHDETVAFVPAIFTPPKAAVTAAPTRAGFNQTVILGAILGAAVVIGGLIIYSAQSGNASNSNTRGTSASENATKTTHPDIGRTGRLTTNQRIRSAPTLDSQILGVHYHNARIKVLDITSYSTNEGPMLWYKVNVLQNGCDYEGIRGCGNDLNEVPGIAAMEGWTSAKNIQLD